MVQRLHIATDRYDGTRFVAHDALLAAICFPCFCHVFGVGANQYFAASTASVLVVHSYFLYGVGFRVVSEQ